MELAKVYFTKDISPEGLLKIYDALEIGRASCRERV